MKLKIPFSGTGPFDFTLKKGNRRVPESDRVRVIPYDDYVIVQIKGKCFEYVKCSFFVKYFVFNMIERSDGVTRQYISYCFPNNLDADPEDTGPYRLEIENDSGVGTCDFGVKVKGLWTGLLFLKSQFTLLLVTFLLPSITWRNEFNLIVF